MKSNDPRMLKRIRAERRRVAIEDILKHAEGKHLILEAVVNHHADPNQEDHCYLEDVQLMLGMEKTAFETYLNALVVDDLVMAHDHGDHERFTPTDRGVAYCGQNLILREAYERVEARSRERWAFRMSIIALVISVAALFKSFF